jgi:NhaP-type Na+/H+ or K+/H+ antiporter
MAELLLAADTGFTFGDRFALGVLAFGMVLVAGIAALSHEHERTFSASIIYLALGLVASLALAALGVDALDPIDDHGVVERVTELALPIAVFTTAISIERRLTWRGWRTVVSLIALVMPLSIAAVAVFGAWVMGLSAGAALLLGAVLAPTDPVLAGDVGVTPPGDPAEREAEARFSLGTEAALNDGLASPFVLLGILVAGKGGTSWLVEWAVADLVYASVVGALIGAAGGYGLGAVAFRLRDARLLDERLDQFFAVPAALIVFGVAEVAGAYGLVAVFCAGVAFRRYEFGHEHNRRLHDGAELVEKFGELIVIVMLGSVVTLAGLRAPGVAGWLLVPLLLFVVRPALAMGVLVRSGMRISDRLFIAWFGVRGVAALYYAAVVVGADVLSPTEEVKVFWTTAVCVMVSIVVHGASATRLARRLLS